MPSRYELEPEEPVPLSEAFASEAGPRRLRVLLAEDNLLNRILESELVRRLGHEVKAVANGREAVSAAEEDEFDLVLMNISMPEMNGIDATRAIRRGRGNRCPPDVPIVAITGHAMEGDRERFLDQGVNDYLPKPFGLKELARMLRRWQEFSLLRPRTSG